jgi:hypothetical protein
MKRAAAKQITHAYVVLLDLTTNSIFYTTFANTFLVIF